ncbi:MAG TPA: YcxB family protein [Gemmataceae bacterium]|jgi:hypothetical protein
MASGITTTPLVSALAGFPLSVEYTLEVADRLALDMFLYNTVIRKRWRFRIKYHVTYLLVGVILGTILGVLVWSGVTIWNRSGDPVPALFAGCASGLGVFLAVLIGLLPGSSLHKIDRAAQEKRFRQVRHRQLRAGLLRYPQRCRVALTPEWFTETVEFRETGIAVEINEHKETRVWWTAVTGIDIAAEHAFFTVKDKGWLILPRAAFADEASFRAFVDTARSYRDAAHRAPAPVPPPLAAPDTRIAGELSL